MKKNHPQSQMNIFHRLHGVVHIIIMAVVLIALALIITILRPGSLFAGATDNVTGWAWSGVAGGGWISLNATNTGGAVDYGVHIDEASGSWSGSGWSSNVGWVDFGSSSCGPAPTTDMTTGVTSGFAKVRAGGSGGFSGCINMAGNGVGAAGGVVIDVDETSSTYGQMSGYAWSGDDVIVDTDPLNPGGEWTANGIADVGLGWIDFSYAMVDLELEDDPAIDLFLDGQCNENVTFTWNLTDVDEATCELFYTDGTNTILVSSDLSSQPIVELITGPANTNLAFQIACNATLDGSLVTSNTIPLMCADEIPPVCEDGIDNDGDGTADTYGANGMAPDPQCACTGGATESGTCISALCQEEPENPLCQLLEGNNTPPVYIES
ncbi:hypothetical protein H6776_00645 [Candidatus Nomurabacteria bacterium]|nr:hypothetical protein [Candidatus Nomurabacteria bacterium]